MKKILSDLLLVGSSCLVLGSPPALAQLQLERVEVTGSSLRRVDAETALPIQVITRTEIEQSGATTIEQLLQTVSAMASSGGLTASSASSFNTGGISSVSLRGLTSLRTLVLLNGRRMAPYGIGFVSDSVSVDINSIPLAAIERVEVLKDGASAIYGSDAIAGVINFILRRNFKGAEISADYGDTTAGGGDSKRVSAAWGHGDLAADRYNVMLTGSLQKEGALFGRDRIFAGHSYNVASQNDLTSGHTFPANIAAVDGSFQSGNPTAASGCVAPYSFIDPLFPPDSCSFDPAPLITLLPSTERASLFASAKYVLNNDLEAFVEASFNRTTQRTVVQPVPLSDQFTLPANNPLYNLPPYAVPGGLSTSTIILTPASAYYPTAYVQSLTGGTTPDLFVRYRSAVTGDRDFTDISESPRLAFGIRGTAISWDFDAAVVYSSSEVREQLNHGYPIYSQILPLLNSGTVNFFGPSTPSVDAQLQATNFIGDAFKVTSSLSGLGAKATREVTQLPGGPVALALGAEARQEKYRFDPSAELSKGDISGYGGDFAFIDKARHVGSLFAEVNIPIAKGFEADAAVRYDKYQGSGDSTTPKLSLRWQPATAVLLRGSIGQGFRAPSLGDLYAPKTTGVSQPGLSDPLRCPTTNDFIKDCFTQFSTSNGGNSTLKPERSSNISLGLVFEPARNLSFGVDAFKITLKDTISNGLPQAVILGDLTKYGQYVTRGAPDVVGLPGPITHIEQTNVNTGETRLAGYDVDANWRILASDLGQFAARFNGTYFLQYDTENPDGTFTPNVANLINATTGGVIPRWKTRQSLTWSRHPWEATLAMNWQSGYADVPGNLTGDERRVGAYETFDIQSHYSGLKDLLLAFGVKNLLNRDPPYTNQGFSFQQGYDPQYADPRGRFIYVRATYAFK